MTCQKVPYLTLLTDHPFTSVHGIKFKIAKVPFYRSNNSIVSLPHPLYSPDLTAFEFGLKPIKHFKNRIPEMDTVANSEDPDEMPHKVAFHQGLHCLLRLKQASEKDFGNYNL